jgi:hypothetical protein
MPAPWPLDALGSTVRSMLGTSERVEADVAAPLREPGELEAKLDRAVVAVERACESLERHAEVLGTLSDSLPPLTESLPPLTESLPPLTESVTRLTEQLGRLMEVTAPFAAAEREVSRLDRLLRRRAQPPATTASEPEAPTAP